MLPDHRVARELHGPQFERAVDVPGGLDHEWIRDGRVQHRVAVTAPHCREAGVEVGLCPVGLANDDEGSTQCIQLLAQHRQIDRVRKVHADDLSPTVHAGIGATGSDDVDVDLQHLTQRTGEMRLNGVDTRIGGETVERVTLVGDGHARTTHDAKPN